MALAADGKSDTEIASELFVSPLGARDRAQLVVFAHQSGLVRPPR